ncbi:archaellar assembly protein FlaJ [Halonotius pteroides]|jgi:flagellar protein FlaJ|uniref:Flagellar assembly protein FlaJ n=1 Tax=Halonotius pteroides TaxID=268735 RepID=A0A3A6QRG4_9EURY|nr:archaellar assembly protein FlaJ [Halonotius pteroides]RJX51428.1 flagellar assembly protein FlaJ [Halonotius pteroides]
MATQEGSGDRLNSLLAFVSDVLASYSRLDMSRRRYMLLIFLPTFSVFLLSIAAAIVLQIPVTAKIPIPLLGLLVWVTGLLYPKLYITQKRTEIEDKFHLAMTHLTVLSTTNIDRVEVFRRLAAEDEYGALADELGQIVGLVDTWNQSIDDACRRRAKEVPSDVMSDLYERLAFTLEAGEELKEFMLDEQDFIIENYETIYEGQLANLEVMEDLYISMILSMTFGLVFAIVLPILTGVNPTVTVSAVIGLFFLVQVAFFFVIRNIAPYDPVWYFPEPRFVEDKELWAAIFIGSLGSLSIIFFMGLGFLGIGPGIDGVLFFLDTVPLPLYVSIPVTPLLITGIVMRMEEERIKERDEQYPNFIRSLGTAETAQQATTVEVLKTLRQKDFGGLTPVINRLYRRLSMRLSPENAWGDFSLEAKSYLMQKYSEMYLVGRQMGGTPQVLGELISQNMNTINQLREQRRQETVTLIGLLYGISAAAVFAFFIGLEVANILGEFSGALTLDQAEFGQLIYTQAYNVPVIEYLLLLVVLFNAALSSLMIRTIDGGNKATAYVHFVLLTWLGAGVAIFTRQVVSSLLQIQI